MLLECRDLTAAYGRSGVLHGVSLGVPHGVVFAMIGRNGMGKTTFAHVVTGLMRSTGGSITFEGKDVTDHSPERISNLGISLVPQGHRVFPSLTVRENLEVASRSGGHWDVDKVVERFPILRERWTQHAGVLSGGQQQMLTIARALVRNPRLIIMDEPSEGLDPERVGVVRGVIAELRELGTAVLLIEQKIQLVLDVADTVAVMSRGEIVQLDPIEKHRKDPQLMASHLGFI